MQGQAFEKNYFWCGITFYASRSTTKHCTEVILTKKRRLMPAFSTVKLEK
jgi:hypothetical protein